MKDVDLFNTDDDPMINAARLLHQHDIIAVPGVIMRQCLDVLRILVCETEDINETLEVEALILRIEAAWQQGLPTAEKESTPSLERNEQ